MELQNNMDNETTIKTNAEKFYESLQYRYSPHRRVYAIDRFSKEDYFPNQEQKDLILYRSFMNSSAWDMVNEVLQSEESEILSLRKRSAMHDDV